MATETNRVLLNVNGKAFSGWTSLRVSHSIEQVAGAFSVELTDRWPGQATRWDIPPGAKCTLWLGDDIVITGYVDVARVGFGATEHLLNVVGRDVTGDLVDCSVPFKQYNGASFEAIAAELCAPYGIPVLSQISDDEKVRTSGKKPSAKGAAPKQTPKVSAPLAKQATNPGETVFRFLEKLARQAGVLLTSDGLGALVITRAGANGQCRTALVEGDNLLEAQFEVSHAQLYRTITVNAQQPATAGVNGVNNSTSTVARAGAVLSDTVGLAAVTRPRVLILNAETNATPARVRERAEWEASYRQARAYKVTALVQGWREKDGDLWRINRTVRVTSPTLKVDWDMLIAGVEYSLDAQGTTTRLTLYLPDAFTLLKEIPPPVTPGQGTGVRAVNADIGRTR